MNAMYDPQGGVDDDTADLGYDLDDLGYDLDDEPEVGDRRRLRPSLLVRRVHGAIVLACYGATLTTAVWLLIEAFLHAEALIMLLSLGLLAWLLPHVLRLWRWQRTVSRTGEALPVWWLAQLVVGVLTALNLFLLVYAHV